MADEKQQSISQHKMDNFPANPTERTQIHSMLLKTYKTQDKNMQFLSLYNRKEKLPVAWNNNIDVFISLPKILPCERCQQ